MLYNLLFLLSILKNYQVVFYNCFLITVFVLPDTYDTDGYNPEAPSITNTSRPMYRHRVHAQRPNLIGLTSGDMDLPPRGTMINLFFLFSYQEWQTFIKNMVLHLLGLNKGW